MRTGGSSESKAPAPGSVHTLDASGNLGEREEDEDEIPDMEDDEDDEEAIIRDSNQTGTKAWVTTITPPSFDTLTSSAGLYEPTLSTLPTLLTTAHRACISPATHPPLNRSHPKI